MNSQWLSQRSQRTFMQRLFELRYDEPIRFALPFASLRILLPSFAFRRFALHEISFGTVEMNVKSRGWAHDWTRNWGLILDFPRAACCAINIGCGVVNEPK